MVYAVIAVIALILAGVGAYYMARFMKGKLEIELSRDSASSEELIRGRVSLEAKKNIHGLLKVSLVGREKRKKRRAGSDNDSTEWVEVYRYDHVLEETRDFEPGFKQDYSFDLLAPTVNIHRSPLTGSTTAMQLGPSILAFCKSRQHSFLQPACG